MLPITIGSIFLGLALLILLVLFLVRPFFMVKPQRRPSNGQREQLLLRKEALLDAIRALDFDHDTGNLPDVEYEQQRSALMSEAAVTLKALDELPADPADADIYAQIETAVSSIKVQRSESAGAPSQFCTNCGQRLDSDDKFCAHCGQAIYAVQPSI